MKNIYYSCITNCSRHWITHVEETEPFPALGKLTFYRKVEKVLVKPRCFQIITYIIAMGCLGTDGVWGTVKVSFDFGQMVREKQRRVGFYRKEQCKDQPGAGPYWSIRRNNKPTRTAGE